MRMLLILLLLSFCVKTAQAQEFEPTWASLEQYEPPEWFRDAKYGIFMHWGPQSLPGVDNSRDGWYARHMYMQEGAPWGNAYEHHVEHYGHPTTFGYKDLIPLWTAENWDPRALVQLYKEIGARYIVPVAVHHDNFDLWDSEHQPWNAVNMGPQRDIIGEWKAAAEQHGLRFGVSSHAAQTWWWFQTTHGADAYGPQAGIPYDGRLRTEDGGGTWWEGYDPQMLYGRPHDEGEHPDSAFVENWFRRHLDLIDSYEPDLLYFDGELPFFYLDRGGLDVAAHFYNNNQQWHGGFLEAVLNLKFIPDAASEHAVVIDIEKGQSATLRPAPWQTDTPLTGHWFYTRDAVLSDTLVVHNLCDIVSKNGNLLLNVGLFPDGTIPPDQEAVLRSAGDWLAINGEAIYETRPWITFGEGPSVVGGGEFNLNDTPFTSEDVRFTTREDTLYAIFFGRPESGAIQIESLRRVVQVDRVGSVELLGYEGAIEWEQDEESLRVLVPLDAEDALAYTLRVMPASRTAQDEPSQTEAFSVRQYPNPFSGSSGLYVQVPAGGRVSAHVFDLHGRLVQEYSGYAEPNTELEISLDFRGLASGVYICRVTSGDHLETMRLVHIGR